MLAKSFTVNPPRELDRPRCHRGWLRQSSDAFNGEHYAAAPTDA
jgi:hypothetical protein